jgi:cysteine desulfurase
MIERYFDNAATSPLDPRVREAMVPWLGARCGNAHSVHEAGRAARAAVERAREQVARLLGAQDPMEVTFTSGATEALNTALASFSRLAISPFEHSAVREPALHRAAEVLANDDYALSSPKHPCDLVAVMAVNNETGAMLEAPRGHRTLVDATQAAGKTPFRLGDLAAISAHKFHGPQGVGALFVRGGEWIEPLLRGGEHENGLRAGTLNVAGIVGMGEAARIAHGEAPADRDRALEMREMVLAELDPVTDWWENRGAAQSPFILSLSFAGVEGETLVLELDRLGYAISSGAACSSRSTEPSHVLTALGYPEARIRGAVRISFGRLNTPEGALAVGRALASAVQTVRNIGFRR